MTDNDEHKNGKPMQPYRYRVDAREDIESFLRRVLWDIGFRGHADVLLVSFPAAGARGVPIHIDPEDVPYDPSVLSNVVGRTRQLYKKHLRRYTSDDYRDPEDVKNSRDSLRRELRVKAIEEALASSAPGTDQAFFASTSARLGNSDVHVVVCIDRTSLAKVPHLEAIGRDVGPIRPSFVHAVIYDILDRAKRALPEFDPSRDYHVVHAHPAEVARSAAASFVEFVAACALCQFSNNADAIFSSISALPYEGRSGLGRLVIARKDHPSVKVLMRFDEAIYIEDTQAIRKLLEASGSESDLLINGYQVFGLGRLTAAYDVADETAFIVSVTGRGTWELLNGDQALLTVRDGTPHLPRPLLDAAYFIDVVERLLPGADRARLLRLATAAGQHQHGAMLIISSDAAAEAERLAPQAWAVEPVRLASRLLRQLTSMDGGVLIDAGGWCYAIGVILDGRACGAEDPARGSRFNNAVRYLESPAPPAVVVVYSADGDIEILPRLLPRVKRSMVEQALQRYLSLSVPGERRSGLADAEDWVRQLEFYLSDEQCRLFNEAKAAFKRWREKTESVVTVELRQPLEPNPDMNDMYWLPEDTETIADTARMTDISHERPANSSITSDSSELLQLRRLLNARGSAQPDKRSLERDEF